VCFAHTYQTRAYAAVVAARLDRALVTDVTGVARRDGEAVFTRPMFQGKLAAEVVADGPAPHLVSFQIGAFRADAAARGTGAPVVARTLALDAAATRQRAEAPFQETRASVDLTQAERIVAVGRGIKAQEHVALARRLAAAFGAELAASRPICDNGWLPMDRQIGSSGQTVAPRLYVALGISGAIQHVVGMKGARTIVAINKDAEAPIFQVSDYGLVADLFKAVPEMVEEVKKLKG
jgi:electron transfer flavoprotein alpha subunit